MDLNHTQPERHKVRQHMKDIGVIFQRLIHWKKNCCQQLLSVTGHTGQSKIKNQTQFWANSKVHRYLQCYTHGHGLHSQWI